MTGYWNHIPLFRYLLPFVIGIISAIQLNLHQDWLGYCFYAFTILYFLFQYIYKLSSAFRLQPLHGVLLHLMLFFAGIFIVIVKTPIYNNNYFMHQTNDDATFSCRITKPPEIGEKSIKLYVEINYCLNDSTQKKVMGNSLLYVAIDSLNPPKFNYGDIIYVKNKFKEPDEPKNPNAFNYKKYLANQRIYHTAFLKTEDYYSTSENNGKWIWEKIFACKLYFIHLMENTFDDEDALGVGLALIVGYKEGIDSEIQAAYTGTGTMHILAVSGLHVGIVFAILEMLFRPFNFFFKKRKKALLVKTIIILIVIWLYACLSGLSPSVMRSAVMFSFLAFGKLYERQVETFNILFVSMLVLLISNPYQITQVGFQLSYLAVGGIVFFQPIIARLWRPRYAIVKYFWALTAVSLAAQLATSPIGIFYFHQFPNYFLISNCIAIPMAFLILVFGLAFFALGAIPYVGSAVGFVLENCLRFLNASMVYIEKLPYAVTGNLYLNIFQLSSLYIAILFCGAFLVLKEKKYVILMLVCILCCSASMSLHQYQNNNRHELLAYSLKNNTAILLNDGTNGYIFTDMDSLPDSDEFKFSLKNDFIKKGIKNVTYINILTQKEYTPINTFYYCYPFLSSNKKTIFFLDPETRNDSVSDNAIIDYVFITQNPFLKIDSTYNPFPNATFIISNSNAWKSNNYWVKQFGKMDIPVHSLKSEGSFDMKTTNVRAGFLP